MKHAADTGWHGVDRDEGVGRARRRRRAQGLARWAALAIVLVGIGAVSGCASESSDQSGDPPGLLTRRDAEPPGEHCALGGTVLRAGLDRDGNGVLDDAEVEHSELLCDVSTAVLVRQDRLEPSLECPAGGIAVQTGVDDNRDGVLQDAEIDQATRVCDSLELWDRDFTAADWMDPLKVAALKGARVVVGSLTISTTEPLSLPLLELVTGDLYTGAPTAMLAFPALRRVAGNLGVGTATEVPALPVLTGVGGNVFVGSGGSALELPALAEIGGNLTAGPRSGPGKLGALYRVHGELFVTEDSSLIDAPNLQIIEGPVRTWFTARGALTLPRLASIGGAVTLEGMLSSLRLDQLTSIGGGIQLSMPPQARLGLSLPALQTIGGDLRDASGSLTIIDLPQLTRLKGELYLARPVALTSISMPRASTIDDDVFLIDTTALTQINLGSLSDVGSFTILNSPALTTLSLASLYTVRESSNSNLVPGLRIMETALQTIDLPSLRSVVGVLGASGCPALRSVQLPQLTTATSLQMYECPLLNTVAAPRLTSVEAININDSPVHTLELGKLATVSSLHIDGSALTDLSGLRSLTSAGVLALYDNDQLLGLGGLAVLRRVTSLKISSNGALTSLDGLERLTEIPGHLWLEYNSALTSIAGLRNLTHVGGYFRLGSNGALADLAFLSLSSIGGDLDVIDMDAVTSLSGLDTLTAVGGLIRFIDNGNLPAAAIQAFLSRF